MEIISRKKARKLNLKRFFLDKECPHGHNVERLVSNGTCIKCSNIKSSLWIRKNYIIKFKTKRKDHYLNNKEHVSKTNRIYRNKNVEKINAYQKEWRLKNSERLKIMIKNWCRINKEKVNTQTAMRRAKKAKATPLWADMSLIRDIYAEANYQQMEVDHIIPLRGKNICGLHWEGNLQLLTKSENRKKWNLYS